MEKSILDSTDRRAGMKVPEGYFESVVEKITSSLPDVELPPQEPITLWGRVRPWLYMAAMFIGIALMFQVFSWKGTKNNDNTVAIEDVQDSQSTEIEDIFFYDNVTDYAIYEYIAEGYEKK